VTLLGDICQAVSLLAGQGVPLAIAGAYLLGRQLPSANSIVAALARRQQLWQPLSGSTRNLRVGPCEEDLRVCPGVRVGQQQHLITGLQNGAATNGYEATVAVDHADPGVFAQGEVGDS
jgi:hypothetical protein